MASFSRWNEGDPKFWPKGLKLWVLFNISLYTFLGNFYAAGISTGFIDIATKYRVSLYDCIDVVSYSVLALGCSSIIMMPLALTVGKRPTLLLCAVIFLAGAIWSVQASTFGQFYGSRILGCIGAGAVETIGPSILGDIYFEKYFASAMAIFTMALSLGTQFGPLIAGYIIGDAGVKYYDICTVALVAFNLLTMLFFLPETSFRRATYHGESVAELDQDAKAHETKHNDVEHAEEVTTLEHVPSVIPNPMAPHTGSYFTDIFQFRNRCFDDGGLKSYPKRFIRPFGTLLVPQVLFAALAFGIIVGGIVVIGSLAAILLTVPPYLFSPEQIGLVGIPSFIGVVIAYPIGGPFTDWLSQKMRSRRPDGHHQPEDRMPALIVPFLLCPVGLIVFGYMMAQHQPFIKAAVGIAIISGGQVLVPSVVLSYIVDAYPQMSGEALIIVNGGKNCLAFGLTKVAVQWMQAKGLAQQHLELAGVTWAVLGLALPLYFAGPWLRKAMSSYIY